MSRSRQIILGALTAVVMVAAACADSTGPKGDCQIIGGNQQCTPP